MTRARSPSAGAHPLIATLGLMLTSAVALGMARFAYALVLPEMRSDLSWSFATAGALNTANAVGYLVGTLLAGATARWWGERRAFVWTLAVTGVALLASAVSGNVVVLLCFRLLAGASGAVCFVLGAALVAQAGRELSQRRATVLFVVYFAGGGVGIVLSGLAVPAVLAEGGWRMAWVALGVLSLLALAGAIPAAAAVPETPRNEQSRTRERPRLRRLWALLLSYGLFGAGYIAYMTFVIAALTAAGAGSAAITTFWAVLGMAAALGGFVWGRLLTTLPAGVAIAVVETPLVVGALLPVLNQDHGAAAVSAVLFGGTFLTVVTATTTAVRRALPPTQWTDGIVVLASSFALGQCVGPLLAGALSDSPGGVRVGLIVGAGLVVVSALVALLHDRAVTRDTEG